MLDIVRNDYMLGHYTRLIEKNFGRHIAALEKAAASREALGKVLAPLCATNIVETPPHGNLKYNNYHEALPVYFLLKGDYGLARIIWHAMSKVWKQKEISLYEKDHHHCFFESPLTSDLLQFWKARDAEEDNPTQLRIKPISSRYCGTIMFSLKSDEKNTEVLRYWNQDPYRFGHEYDFRPEARFLENGSLSNYLKEYTHVDWAMRYLMFLCIMERCGHCSEIIYRVDYYLSTPKRPVSGEEAYVYPELRYWERILAARAENNAERRQKLAWEAVHWILERLLRFVEKKAVRSPSSQFIQILNCIAEFDLLGGEQEELKRYWGFYMSFASISTAKRLLAENPKIVSYSELGFYSSAEFFEVMEQYRAAQPKKTR